MPESTSKQAVPAVWRAIDANLNRASEGLRLLEDIARFTLNDSELCRKLKAARHYLARAAIPWQEELLTSRDAAGDIGREAEFEESPHREDLISLVRSNSKRVQEALRTLEELAKLPGLGAAFDWTKLKEHRFAAYDLEKELVQKLNVKNQMEK
ncbi:MAG: hypothetical protein HY673_22085 [Chloroflexi bacterium]|nr:hypothetical protein [Chloroflexota bacterium]